MRGKKEKKSNWEVKIRCEVYKYVYCENCTREEAFNDPFGFSVDEQEAEMPDWEAISIKENI